MIRQLKVELQERKKLRERERERESNKFIKNKIGTKRVKI